MEHREADVCVVGAGFAGLAAARFLQKHRKQPNAVVVLEASDRVGGRVRAETLDNGVTVSMGGTWIGDGQDRLKQIVTDVGLGIYPQYVGDPDPDDAGDPLNPSDKSAETILLLDGVTQRYKGLFAPIGLDNLAVLGAALEALRELSATLPLDRPWDAPNARGLDAQTLGAWIASSSNVPSQKAQTMLRAMLRVLFSAEPEEVSLLGSLVLARGGSGRGFEYYASQAYTETHLVDGDGGGIPEVAVRMARELGDAVRTASPVRRIEHSDTGVVVIADGVTVRAQYVIVTAPPVLAGQIVYAPPLPDAHGQVMRKMPPGAIWRFIAVYDQPFWRASGLSGETVAPDSLVPVSIDQCPKPGPDGNPASGILSCYSIGPAADVMSRMDAATRRATVLGELAARLGDAALDAVAFGEFDWSADPWACGGMIGHLPPGVLTSFGRALHEPVGRIFWAGTERATEMHGLIEGAIRSGEHAAKVIVNLLPRAAAR
jgi:monoamine oxidase